MMQNIKMMKPKIHLMFKMIVLKIKDHLINQQVL